MNEKPEVSVVIPMHNEAENIFKCLYALDAQVSMPHEVIVIDNNSSDNSVDIVRECLTMLNRLKVIITSESRHGPAAARNKGIKVANGDIIAFTDADCIVDSHWVQRISDIFARDHALDAVGGVERPFGEPSTLIHRVVSATWLPPSDRLEMVLLDSKGDWLKSNFISTFNCAVRRSCLENIRGFDESYYPCGEDMDLWFRAVEQGAKIVAWHPEIIVEHHQALSMKALLRKMFFYGEGTAHLVKNHFPGHLYILSRWFGSAKIPSRRLAGVIWNQSVMGLLVLIAALAVSSISQFFVLPAVFLFLAILGWKLCQLMAEKGLVVSNRELPRAVAIYCLRTVAREIGLCYGSIKHRVLCI